MASTIISATVRDQADSDTDPIMTASRPVGAAVACAIAVVAAFLGFAISQSGFLGVGVPAAAIAGWFLGPSIRTGGGLFGPAFGMAIVTIAIADGLFIVGAAGNSGGAASEAIWGYLGLWAIGLLIVGIPMLILTVPCALVWAFIVRKLARDGMGISSAPERKAA
ncbi:MAG TPA: hypothetical protein VK697_11345 [Methylomirabilota bacterium]|jgi:hypothetical protein|nr:hypothetical protein [Methylomirabilota bacterium]